MKKLLVLILILTTLSSCSKKAAEDEASSSSSEASDSSAQNSDAEGDCIEASDIIVSNSGHDAVIVLNSDGSYKNIALNVNNIAESVYGIAWDRVNNRLLVAVDGADRVMAIDPVDCSSSNFILDGNLSGATLKGLTVLDNGDVLIVEGATVERFTDQGMRITTGGWPKSLQSGGTGISAKSSGGFVHCSTTTDVVRTYDDSGTQVATKSSGITNAIDAMDCIELANGNIAVTWNGTGNDTVAIYNSDFTSTVATYTDISFLVNPGGIAETLDGDILITDKTNHYIVKLNSDGTYSGIIGDGVLNIPEFIVVVPE